MMNEERIRELLDKKDKIMFKCRKEDGTNFTLDELTYVLTTTKRALNRYYKDNYDIADKELLEQLSPEIVNDKNGCIEITAILNGVAIEVLTSIIIFGAKKLFPIVKDKMIELIYKMKNQKKSRSSNNEIDGPFPNFGASFFVSYLYFLLIDSNHNNWQRIQNNSSRISRIRAYEDSWKSLLKKVLNMNDIKLNTNKIGLSAEQIKNMANELLKK